MLMMLMIIIYNHMMTSMTMMIMTKRNSVQWIGTLVPSSWWLYMIAVKRIIMMMMTMRTMIMMIMMLRSMMKLTINHSRQWNIGTVYLDYYDD